MNSVAAYLAANPGKTARDYKGKDTAPFDKSYAPPGEVPFDRLDRYHVRYRADGIPARLLPRNVRQAAARDEGMFWDEAARAYRLVSARKAGEGCDKPVQYVDSADPRASAPASSRGDLDSVEVGGGRISLRSGEAATGAGHDFAF